MSNKLNRRVVVGGLTAAGLAAPLWAGAGHAATRRKKKRKKASRSNYSPMPREALDQGQPFHLVVSIREQKAHVYAGTQLIGSSRISSGKPGHDTPQGIFTVMEKRRHHRSNIYSNAPMPYMQRLTWSGIALHEGHVPNRPASHGCVRLPRSFAADLFKLKTRNRHVIIADHMPAGPRCYVFVPCSSPGCPRPPVSIRHPARTAPPGAKGAPLRIYLTRHTGKHRLERVQHMLSRLGFYNGPQDGLMGRKHVARHCRLPVVRRHQTDRRVARANPAH
jgi:hypothetical protein